LAAESALTNVIYERAYIVGVPQLVQWRGCWPDDRGLILYRGRLALGFDTVILEHESERLCRNSFDVGTVTLLLQFQSSPISPVYFE